MDANVKEKENIDVTSIIEAPQVKSDVQIKPLDHEAALDIYPDDVKKEILALADAIDVTQLEKVMSYGRAPILRAFEEAGAILKAEEGSSADQTVIRQVIEISKKANESYEDFNLVLQEPNFFEKVLLKLSKSRSKKRKADIKEKAITNYKLLISLHESCDLWLESLKEAMGQITLASSEDKINCSEIEKYIVAGYLAKERISKELEVAKEKYEVALIQEAEDKYNTLKEGAEIFDIALSNLEKSRAAFKISIGQLMLSERANRNIQIAVNTQKDQTMAIATQQIRNAVLDAKNKEVLEGQKALVRLNDELLKKVSSNIVLTAEESEEVLANGIYTVESAITAAKTVIDGCQSIVKIRASNKEKMNQDVQKLKTLINELEPYISSVKDTSNVARISAKSSTSNSVSTKNGGNGLKF